MERIRRFFERQPTLDVEFFEGASFHSEKDEQIAFEIKDRLDQMYVSRKINKKRYEYGLENLKFITPFMNEKDRRQIGDIDLGGGLEKLISSRLSAEEIDITHSDSAWGMAPARVKEAIFNEEGGYVENTDRCTVACKFCCFADKGPIKMKISLESMFEIIEMFGSFPAPAGDMNVDTLYMGTDVFDSKWELENGEDFDYTDIAKMYWSVVSEKRGLYTSTAMPVGEELRVIGFALELIRHSKENSFIEELRISKTNKNKKRVDALLNLLNVLYKNDLKFGKKTGRIVYSEGNRDDMSRIRGSAWDKEISQIKWKDIFEPNCIDATIVHPGGIDFVVMEGASNERPNGERRETAFFQREDGKYEYLIPRQAIRIRHHKKGIPNIQFIRFICQDGEVLSEDIVEDENNPHRSFLKMIWGLRNYVRNPDHSLKVSGKKRHEWWLEFREDVDSVVRHMSTGAENISMDHWLRLLSRYGFLPTMNNKNWDEYDSGDKMIQTIIQPRWLSEACNDKRVDGIRAGVILQESGEYVIAVQPERLGKNNHLNIKRIKVCDESFSLEEARIATQNWLTAAYNCFTWDEVQALDLCEDLTWELPQN